MVHLRHERPRVFHYAPLVLAVVFGISVYALCQLPTVRVPPQLSTMRDGTLRWLVGALHRLQESAQSRIEAYAAVAVGAHTVASETAQADADRGMLNAWAMLLQWTGRALYLLPLRLFVAVPISVASLGWSALTLVVCCAWVREPRVVYTLDEHALEVTTGRFLPVTQRLLLVDVDDVWQETHCSELLISPCYGLRRTVTVKSKTDGDQSLVRIPAASTAFYQHLDRHNKSLKQAQQYQLQNKSRM